jgi:hypothetical protein
MSNRNAQREVTRKIKQGPVDLDFEECALVVHYEVETVEVDDRGGIIELLDRKPEVRRIKIKSLSPDKNMAQLAADIVDKCKYIHPSRVEEIEQLLIRLRKHNLSLASNQNQDMNMHDPNNNNNDHDDRYSNMKSGSLESKHGTNNSINSNNNNNNNNTTRSASRGRGGVVSNGSGSGNNSNNHNNNDRSNNNNNNNQRRSHHAAPVPVDPLPAANMSELDDYLEMLYQVSSGKSEREKEESLKLQEKGTAMILKLCRHVMNLEQLIQNSTVMGALTRVLQEEFKKSLELTFNILR